MKAGKEAERAREAEVTAKREAEEAKERVVKAGKEADRAMEAELTAKREDESYGKEGSRRS